MLQSFCYQLSLLLKNRKHLLPLINVFSKLDEVNGAIKRLFSIFDARNFGHYFVLSLSHHLFTDEHLLVCNFVSIENDLWIFGLNKIHKCSFSEHILQRNKLVFLFSIFKVHTTAYIVTYFYLWSILEIADGVFWSWFMFKKHCGCGSWFTGFGVCKDGGSQAWDWALFERESLEGNQLAFVGNLVGGLVEGFGLVLFARRMCTSDVWWFRNGLKLSVGKPSMNLLQLHWLTVGFWGFAFDFMQLVFTWLIGINCIEFL